MTDIFKIIHPTKYFNDYVSRDVRPDGREFNVLRNIKLNVGSIHTAEASAVVKCGNTTVVCGIKLELARPKAEEPELGFLVTNVELPALCSSKIRPGPPSDHAQVTSKIVSDIVVNSKCVDLKDLCIITDKLAWVVYCDLVCIDNDGSLVDACIISLLASLKTLSLPLVKFDIETEEIDVDPNVRTELKVKGLPVATSFSIYNLEQRCILLADPTAFEEDLCGGVGANMIICCDGGALCGTQKFGGSNLTIEKEEEAMKIAKERTKLIEEMVDVCVRDHKAIHDT